MPVATGSAVQCVTGTASGNFCSNSDLSSAEADKVLIGFGPPFSLYRTNAESKWAIERNSLRGLINGFGASNPGQKFPEHPAFGQLTPKAWGVLGYRHIDHHFRQFGV
ncbi:MAG: hypothetical protein ABIO52_09730 [Gemmatimonadaceae bacterium]